MKFLDKNGYILMLIRSESLFKKFVFSSFNVVKVPRI